MKSSVKQYIPGSIRQALHIVQLQSMLVSILAILVLIALTGCSQPPAATKAPLSVSQSTQETPVTSPTKPASDSSSTSTGSKTAAEGADGFAGGRDGSAEHPLSVVLIPAQNQSGASVLGGYAPIFEAITRSTGIHFEARGADNYAAVVQAMISRKADLVYLGPYSYLEARDAGAGELLAVAVRNGSSHYYGGIFARSDAGIKTLKDLKGKSVAFGDINSTSSFNFPCAMMIAAGIDPIRDLSKINLAGNHTNCIAALAAGKVDATCAMVEAFEIGVSKGILDPNKFTMIAKTDPIPGSPWVVHPKLPANVKTALRKAFADVSKDPAFGKNGMRGQDGLPLDKFDTSITDADYDAAMKFSAPVTKELKAEILAKAAQNRP